jgi:DNA repair protein RecO
MAYETYTTEALVCGSKDRNTADRSYLLFSSEAGMLFATARSVREERSRQRYALQDFSLVRVSLVKGKRDWRIGSVEARRNFYHDAVDKAARGSITSLFRLLRRFVQGEAADHKFFDETIEALDLLCHDTSRRQFVQRVLELQLLTTLGYVDKKQLPAEMLEVSALTIADRYSPELERQLGELFAHAVSVSHL